MLHLPTLITERLCLRPFTLADAAQIHALSSDYEIARTTSNTASGRVMQKIGMQREAVLREEIFKDGVYHDAVVYGLINPAHSQLP